jgi:hypothetical protein
MVPRKQKRKWLKPGLIILIKDRQMNILAGCKVNNVAPIGPAVQTGWGCQSADVDCVECSALLPS